VQVLARMTGHPSCTYSSHSGAVAGGRDAKPPESKGHRRDSGEGRSGPDGRRGERHQGDRDATVHRHSLDRLNAINDSLKKKTSYVHKLRASFIHHPTLPKIH